MSRMKVALAILLLACQGLNGNIVRREDAFPNGVYATSENFKKEAAKSLSTISAILETFTEDLKRERMSDELKHDTESKNHVDGINNASPKISPLVQHDNSLKISIPQVKKPENTYYKHDERFGLRMARDTYDHETEENVAVDRDGEEDSDEDELAARPVVKLPTVLPPLRYRARAALGKVEANAFKPVDVHIYIHLDEPRRKHRIDSGRSWERKSRKRWLRF